MKEYKVLVRETLEKTVSVQAESREEAEEKVREAWNQEDYVLTGDDFADVEYIVKTEENYDVLIVRPQKRPERATIATDLATLQGIVGGDIELVYPFSDNACIVCDDEGKLKEKPFNRALRDKEGNPYDIVSGDFIVMGLDEENLCSLTSEQMDYYEKLYQQPEVFVELGGSILAIPVDVETINEEQNLPNPENDFEL